MRILLVTHFFPPGHLGGTEVLSASLAKCLQAIGNSVQVICAESWDTATSYTIHHTDDSFNGVPVRRLHLNWMKAPDVFLYLYNNPQVERHLTDFLSKLQPDILHITSCYSLSASVISAASRLGIPIVLTATDFWFLCARNTLLQNNNSLCAGPESPWKCAQCLLSNAKVYRWPRKILPEKVVATILRNASHSTWLTNQPGLRGMLGNWEDRHRFLSRSLGKVDRIVTASRFLQELFVLYGVPSERIEYSLYGLDASWAKSFCRKPSTKLRIGFIGQIVPMKGTDILIKALYHLSRDLPVELKIFGDLSKDPTYGRQLKDLAADDPRIIFSGSFENNRMGEVLTELDVLAVPSIWYDFPLVIPSAFATRTPVIATNLPGMNELVHDGVNGLLFERYDSQQLGRQIQRLISEPALLNRLCAGIAPVKTLEEMTQEYVTLYDSVVRKSRVEVEGVN